MVCGLAIASSAQQSLKTFTSPDGLFRFHYPNILINCMPPQTPVSPKQSTPSKETQPAPSSISDSCINQGAICDGPGSEGSALACLAYPKEEFKDKPHFVAASFYISQIQSAKTEKACLNGSPDWFVISSKAGTPTINHVEFKAFLIGDNWAGSGQSGPAYRTFHNGTCYELGIQTVISRAEYDPGTVKEFTRKDQVEVEGRLKEAVNSFVFLK
jgi:hypothetical protein